MSLSAFVTVIWNTLTKHQFFTLNFAFKLFHTYSLLLITPEAKNTICNPLITMFTTSWQNLIKIGWSELYKTLSFNFLQKPCHTLTILTYRLRHDFERGFWKRNISWCLSIWYKTSIFRYYKNYVSLTQGLTNETKLKDPVNMEDLTCFFFFFLGDSSYPWNQAVPTYILTYSFGTFHCQRCIVSELVRPNGS